MQTRETNDKPIAKKTPRFQLNYFTIDMFHDWLDFKEATGQKDKSVFFGRRNYELRPFYEDIEKFGDQSKYMNRVLFPERATRNEPWSFEKNMAFLCGLVSSNRTALVLTNIENYGRGNCVTGTMIELLVLWESSYTFSPNANDFRQTVCSPPKNKQSIDELKLTNYKEMPVKDIVNKFNQLIKGPLLKKREQLLNQPLEKQPSQKAIKISKVVSKESIKTTTLWRQSLPVAKSNSSASKRAYDNNTDSTAKRMKK